MKDSLTSYNREDFRQRYKNCYGFLLHEGKRKLVFIKDVASGQVVFKTSAEGPDYYALADANVEFEFLPVTRSWYNLGTKAGLLFRIPAKQYTRGISSANTAYYTVADAGYLSTQKLSLDTLSKVFPIPLSIDSAAFFANKVNFLVLNRAFCITHGVLYFFAYEAGRYNESKRTITLTMPTVHQELMDCIKRRQLPITIEVNE